MNFDCPHCGRKLNLLELQLDEDLSAIIAAQEVFGRHRRLVWSYLEIFGIHPLHARAKKIRVLLDQMKNVYQREGFDYKKVKYRISQAGIAEALNIMISRHFPEPLSDHNYLKKVMISIAEREARGESREAERDMRRREERLQAGDREEAGQDLAPLKGLSAMKSMPAAELTEAQIADNKRRIKGILNDIG